MSEWQKHQVKRAEQPACLTSAADAEDHVQQENAAPLRRGRKLPYSYYQRAVRKIVYRD